jgi:hypothetical protein
MGGLVTDLPVIRDPGFTIGNGGRSPVLWCRSCLDAVQTVRHTSFEGRNLSMTHSRPDAIHTREPLTLDFRSVRAGLWCLVDRKEFTFLGSRDR